MGDQVAKIYQDKKGVLGIQDDDMFVSFFTSEMKEFDESSVKEVGYVDVSASPFNPHQIPSAILQWYRPGGGLEFYFLGWTSRTDMMDYVPIRSNLLMGYHNSENGLSSVYFFVKCGEINGGNVYSYSSDMVISDESIEWVSANGGTFVVPHVSRTSQS